MRIAEKKWSKCRCQEVATTAAILLKTKAYIVCIQCDAMVTKALIAGKSCDFKWDQNTRFGIVCSMFISLRCYIVLNAPNSIENQREWDVLENLQINYTLHGMMFMHWPLQVAWKLDACHEWNIPSSVCKLKAFPQSHRLDAWFGVHRDKQTFEWKKKNVAIQVIQ